MSVFFISDLHFYHKNILSFCPDRNCESIEAMNEKLISNWNELVSENDEVWCLGDISLAFRPIEAFSHRLNGKKFLVPGNHDFCHSSHKKSSTPEKQKVWIEKYESYGWNVQPEQVYFDAGEGSYSGEVFALCHLPYIDADDAHMSHYRRYHNMYPEDTGTILLCGHVHQHWKHRVSAKGTLMINVGVDVWDMKPVSLKQIMDVVYAHRMTNES